MPARLSGPRPGVLAVIVLCAALALLAGCETVVDVAPPSHTPQLVAQSFFAPDSAWAVRVTATAPYTSAARPPYVEDALVEILDGDRLVATPVRADSGTYVARGAGPVPGRTYTLRVAAPGFAPTEGTGALPPPPPVVAFRDTLLPPPAPGSRRQVTRVALTLDDPPGVRDHYALFVVQGRWREDRATGSLTPLPPTLFTFTSDDPAFGDHALDFLDLDAVPYREAFFTDDVFDGQRYTLGFEVQYDAPPPGADVVVRRVLLVVVLSVSEDLYHYWTTAGQQLFTSDNPFAEPLAVHSNMSNGFGVFAGFQYRVFPLGVSDRRVQGYGLGDLCRLAGGRLPVCVAPDGGG